ncbi:hypothetical protein EJ08DRAFT_70343 [Tothia fuscella]|uniref:Uncharacterized protein n=1 Tax=Tothia fuscella TaxID=1048955 RepID=A0A9P4NEZ1_9PEZI|nr:hypothetical protein EJ08DRAFT_70343 [Tothia fuscella]
MRRETPELNEHEALRHYQTTYSLYRTTKDPKWSTHKVLLNLGARDIMIMYLLLAVSLNDYSLRGGQSTSSREAENHFQLGAQLLITRMDFAVDGNTIAIMAAFFFIYLYVSKRKYTAPQRLSQLSRRILDFVRTHDLVFDCVDSASICHQSQTEETAVYSRSLLARLIMWILDEDVKCGFPGSGGDFARYLAQRSTKTKAIYDASRNALGDYWGNGYPHSQMLDDDQNSTVLEFLWALMPLWQDINDLSGVGGNYDTLKSQIEQRFRTLEEHSSTITKPRPRILVNADYDVVLFNALRVYQFRSTISDMRIDTPPEIQASLKIILTIIQ